MTQSVSRHGICVAGNMIVDITNPVEDYPAENQLTVIQDGITRAMGGAACAVTGALQRLDPSLPIQVVGRVGDDAEGDFILRQLNGPQVDLSRIQRAGTTSFTQVMSHAKTKTRTFFVYGGASNQLCLEDFDWSAITADLLHLGYILLLPRLDEADAVYGTKMAHLLHDAKAHGLRTSVDIVSNANGHIAKVAPPALRYTDFLIINELEAQELTGICLRGEDGLLRPGNMNWALKQLFELGVSTWAVIHCPEGGWARDLTGDYVSEPSIPLPHGYVTNRTGAGDAFCSGVLLGATTGKTLAEALHIGTATAVVSLTGLGAYGAMQPLEDVLRQYDQLVELVHET